MKSDMSGIRPIMYTDIYPMIKLQLDAFLIRMGLEDEELDCLKELMYWREYWTGSRRLIPNFSPQDLNVTGFCFIINNMARN